MRLLTIIFLFLCGHLAEAKYQTLPARGAPTCPASGQVFHDHFCWLGETRSHLDCMACPDSSFNANRVIRGGELDTGVLRALKRMGVGLVIDLRAPTEARAEAEEAASTGLAYFNLPMSSSSAKSANANRVSVMRALGMIRYYLQTHSSGKVYVHCQRGEDRTGLVIAAYQLLIEQAPRTEVESEMRKHYYNPYEGLEKVWSSLKASDAQDIVEPTSAEKSKIK